MFIFSFVCSNFKTITFLVVVTRATPMIKVYHSIMSGEAVNRIRCVCLIHEKKNSLHVFVSFFIDDRY